jgi:hypothetical protein
MSEGYRVLYDPETNTVDLFIISQGGAVSHIPSKLTLVQARDLYFDIESALDTAYSRAGRDLLAMARAEYKLQDDVVTIYEVHPTGGDRVLVKTTGPDFIKLARGILQQMGIDPDDQDKRIQLRDQLINTLIKYTEHLEQILELRNQFINTYFESLKSKIGSK